jgi:hypothetical protein
MKCKLSRSKRQVISSVFEKATCGFLFTATKPCPESTISGCTMGLHAFPIYTIEINEAFKRK